MLLTSPLTLIAATAVIFYVVRRGKLYHLLILDLVFIVALREDVTIASMSINATDVVIVVIAGVLALNHERVRGFLRHGIPLLPLWLLLCVLAALAYVTAPINQEYLTDPLRTTYQVYRYALKPLLFYVLAVLLVGNDGLKVHYVLWAMLFIAVGLAIMAIPQGYSGELSTSLLGHKNEFGGAMVVPTVLAVAAVCAAASRSQRILAVALLAVVCRGFLFSGSRGAFVAALSGGSMFLGVYFLTTLGRRRVLRLAGVAVAAVVLTFMLKPDLMERPTVSFMLTAFQGTSDHNVRWRTEERWPHFWKIVRDNPWLGTGTEIDYTLGEDTNTPHNGYLTLALRMGVPAALLWTFFGLQGVYRGIQVFRSDDSPQTRTMGLAIAASIVGLLIHCIVDSTLTSRLIGRQFWILVALAVGLRQSAASVVVTRSRLRVSYRRNLRIAPRIPQEVL